VHLAHEDDLGAVDEIAVPWKFPTSEPVSRIVLAGLEASRKPGPTLVPVASSMPSWYCQSR
jgi:hypothetical protein